MSWNSTDGWTFSTGGIIFFVCVVAASIAFSAWKNKVRRNSLKRRDDGVYVWVEWHGGQRESKEDPSVPGGEWDSEGDGDGGDGGD